MSEPQAIVITPLTPLHVGCNADFEPTHYFIEEGWLYYFDPSRVYMLLSKAEQEEFNRFTAQTRFTPEQGCAMQRFFYQHRAHFKAGTVCVVPVARSVEALYLQRVGVHAFKPREGQDPRSAHPHRLVVERHAFATQNLEPVIPGALIKGTLRMAALSALHSKRTHHASGQRRGQGRPREERQHDPIHALHIHHAMGTGIGRKILACTNTLNKPAPKAASAPPPSAHTPVPPQMTRREVVLGAQHRVLRSEMSLPPESSDTPAHEALAWKSFAELAKMANAYYRPKFNIELHQLEQQGYGSHAWLQNLKHVFGGALREAMDDGRAMLLRIGQHNGKGQLLTNAAWFAYHDDKATPIMFPLGWVIVERANAEPIHEFAAWCNQQSKPNPAPIWAAIEDERKSAEERRVALEHAQRQAEERAAEQAAAEHARQAALNALSPEQRKIEELVQILEASAIQGNTGTVLFQQLWTLLQEALSWPEEEQRACESRLAGLIKVKFPHLGKREKEVKGCLRQLREGGVAV